LGYESLISDCEVIKCNQNKQLFQWIDEIPWNSTTVGVTPKVPEDADKYNEYDELGWQRFRRGNNDDLGTIAVAGWLFFTITYFWRSVMLVITIKLVVDEGEPSQYAAVPPESTFENRYSSVSSSLLNRAGTPPCDVISISSNAEQHCDTLLGTDPNLRSLKIILLQNAP